MVRRAAAQVDSMVKLPKLAAPVPKPFLTKIAKDASGTEKPRRTAASA